MRQRPRRVRIGVNTLSELREELSRLREQVDDLTNNQTSTKCDASTSIQGDDMMPTGSPVEENASDLEEFLVNLPNSMAGGAIIGQETSQAPNSPCAIDTNLTNQTRCGKRINKTSLGKS